MTLALIDSHSHIDFPEFDKDREQALERASSVGVSDIIVSATTHKRWPLLKERTSSAYVRCHYAFGLHPLFTYEHKADHLDDLSSILIREKAVAIGEIGLDYFITNLDKKKQLVFFIAQIEIADELNLPVIIHARKSQDIILKYIRQHPNLRGSFHSFSGSEQQAKQLIDQGFYLGFGGPITYTRATRLRKLVKTLPLESLLLETDSPDLPDAQHHGKRNEPAYIVNIAKTIAMLRNVSVEEIAQTTSNNARTLFKLV